MPLDKPKAGFSLPKLPFAENALEPVISSKTISFHHGKHHAAYVDKLNELIAGTPYDGLPLEEVVKRSAKSEKHRAIFNNAGQAWNHEIYWEQFTPGGARAPEKRLLELISVTFGSLDEMKNKIVASAGTVFGSGWTWLVHDDGKLEIINTAGGDGPLTSGKTALVGIDVWEHAYYLDYENRRPEHVKAVLDNIINWDVVADRLKA